MVLLSNLSMSSIVCVSGRPRGSFRNRNSREDAWEAREGGISIEMMRVFIKNILDLNKLESTCNVQYTLEKRVGGGGDRKAMEIFCTVLSLAMPSV